MRNKFLHFASKVPNSRYFSHLKWPEILDRVLQISSLTLNEHQLQRRVVRIHGSVQARHSSKVRILLAAPFRQAVIQERKKLSTGQALFFTLPFFD